MVRRGREEKNIAAHNLVCRSLSAFFSGFLSPQVRESLPDFDFPTEILLRCIAYTNRIARASPAQKVGRAAPRQTATTRWKEPSCLLLFLDCATERSIVHRSNLPSLLTVHSSAGRAVRLPRRVPARKFGRLQHSPARFGTEKANRVLLCGTSSLSSSSPVPRRSTSFRSSC